jgi:pyrroline-5-carboxylate reductase
VRARVTRQVAAAADVLFVCTKPYAVRSLLAELAPALGPQHLLVSIAAGVTVADLESACLKRARVVRVMPNTPCLVGALRLPPSRARSARPAPRLMLLPLRSLQARPPPRCAWARKPPPTTQRR